MMRILLEILITSKGKHNNGRRYVRERKGENWKGYKEKKSTNGMKRRRRKRKKIRSRLETNEELDQELDQKTVVNILNVPLSQSEIKLHVLSRGLSFCPKPSQIDQFQLKDDVKHFFRRVRPREFFYDPDITTNDEKNPFKRKSKWITSIIGNRP